MRDEPEDLVPPGRLRTMQIINGALVMGLLIFVGLVVYLVHVQNAGRPLGQAPGPPIFSILALGMLTVASVVSAVYPSVVVRQGVRGIARGRFQPPPGDADRLLGLRQTTCIVRLALLEGPAFFCCIAYLLEGQIYVLAAIGVALLLMLSRFPTEPGMRAWLRYHLAAVERERRQEAP